MTFVLSVNEDLPARDVAQVLRHASALVESYQRQGAVYQDGHPVASFLTLDVPETPGPTSAADLPVEERARDDRGV